MISTGSLWEDSESEAESTCSEKDIVDSDAETERAPATPNAKLYFLKKRGKRTKSVAFQDWVEHDDGDVSNHEFPERHRSDDRGKKGVSTEHAKEDQCRESIIDATRAAKVGESTFVMA